MSTAVADVSGLLEAASSPDPAPVTTETPVDESSLEAPETEVQETPEAGAPEAQAAETPEAKIDARTNPDAIRKALRSLRDSSPENAPVARELNNIVGRYKAFTDVFPKVADAKNAKFLLDAVGGGEGLTSLQETIKSVNQTDQMLYAGDPRVLDNIIEDMKRENKLDAFGKLASPFLDKLRQNDEKAYFAALRPHFFQGIVDSGLPDVLEGLEAALSAQVDGKPSPNFDALKALVGEIRKWYAGLDRSVEASRKTALDPDRKAFDEERAAFQSEKTKAFQGEVNSDWNKANNQALGEALKPYLKLPFAKNWTDATKKSVATEITQTLLSELTADKAYQSQMDAFWSESKPDKAKILNFHKSKLDIVAKRIVRDVLDARYPGFSSVKGAPKPAVPGTKPATPTQVTNKPIFQQTKPSVNDVDWNKTSDNLYTTGRFFDKQGKLKTWNIKYK